MNKNEAKRLVLQWVIDNEQEDFFENPSDLHPWYLAILAVYGENYAAIQLGIANGLV